MLIDLSEVKEIQLATGYTDMRKSFNGLIAVIEGEFKKPVEEGTLFLFCGRSAKKLKALYRCRDGYLLLTKEMDFVKFRWPRSVRELQSLSIEQLQRLLVGLTIS